jgi:TorA maturation chaperone TorD/Pyruvate/2-oxoacid:ferredoxin oxidoreductase delta subunit
VIDQGEHDSRAEQASDPRALYTFLAGAFLPPTEQANLCLSEESLARLPAALREEVEGIGLADGREEELAAAYQRLFVGPARPRVYPYESCYRDPQARLAGPWAAQLSTWYAREGLAPIHLQPDHIAVELAFMAHLAGQEAKARTSGDQATAMQYLEQQAAFLQQHLLVWAPEFCRRLQGESDHPFYTGLSRLLSGWLEIEALRFGLHRTGESALAYPSVVVARVCTLCGVCADACQPRALRLAWIDGEARLLFDAQDCTGCRLCADVCPFQALRLGPQPASGTLVSSPLLPCPDCGRSAVPLAFWRHLSRRLDTADPVYGAARRCPACR